MVLGVDGDLQKSHKATRKGNLPEQLLLSHEQQGLSVVICCCCTSASDTPLLTLSVPVTHREVLQSGRSSAPREHWVRCSTRAETTLLRADLLSIAPRIESRLWHWLCKRLSLRLLGCMLQPSLRVTARPLREVLGHSAPWGCSLGPQGLSLNCTAHGLCACRDDTVRSSLTRFRKLAEGKGEQCDLQLNPWGQEDSNGDCQASQYSHFQQQCL